MCLPLIQSPKHEHFGLGVGHEDERAAVHQGQEPPRPPASRPQRYQGKYS